MNMKRRSIISVIILIALLLLTLCEYNSKNPIDQFHYSILLGEFKNYEAAEKYKAKLSTILFDKLRITRISENKYELFCGNYPSSIEAGKNAFNFYLDSLITSYKITNDDKPTFDEYSNILFVAKYLERPTVYNFNLLTKQTEVAWSRYSSQVVALNQTKDFKKAFVTTVLGYNKLGGFPSINNIKMYLYRREEDEDEQIINLGGGNQLYTYWENEDTLKLNHSFIDTTNPKNVIHKIYSFDTNGKQTEVKTRSYDLLANGFPAIPKRIPFYYSFNKRFQLRTVYSQGNYYFYLKDYNKRSEELIASTKNTISDARWSDDSKYLFIITDNAVITKLKTESTGELLVINAFENKLQRTFTKYQFDNILIHGRLLLYDKKLNQSSQIGIYDFIKDKDYYTISMNGGCGLNNLLD
jgi:hypothetical protein